MPKESLGQDEYSRFSQSERICPRCGQASLTQTSRRMALPRDFNGGDDDPFLFCSECRFVEPID